MTVSDRAIGIRSAPLAPALLIAGVVISCMIYANLSFAATKQEDYRYFPPFAPGVNVNMNRDLGAEYFYIARSLTEGNGFANPFDAPTGPTAWMPPILPAILAVLWWACAGNRAAVMIIVLTLQAAVLIGTGLLILAIAGRTTRRTGPGAVAGIYIAVLLCTFHDCFQANGDRWLSLLAIDVLLAGCFWYGPLQTTSRSAAWGAFGGLCALISPIAAFAWGVYSTALGLRQRAWGRTALMLATAVVVLAPWTIRNYLVFGRWIPVKSNLAYEIYQSHCLQSDGLLNGQGQNLHPIHRHSRERREYEALGEIAYVDRKAAQVVKAVAADPLDLLDRIAARFLGATLWYVPTDRSPHASAAWFLWMQRVAHPLPFLGLLVLVFVGVSRGLTGSEWTTIAIYALYLTPYIIVSYYPRYGFPLLAAKALLMLWAFDWALCPRYNNDPLPGVAPRCEYGKESRN
jgi:hypothetical protein